MKKLFLIATILLTLSFSTTYAAENDAANTNAEQPAQSNQHTVKISTDDFVTYTSQAYGFSIKCPWEPVVVDLRSEDINRRGELLVFANDGINVLLGYRIVLDAFDNQRVPDFNKADKAVIDNYIDVLKQVNLYEVATLETISANNKGVFAITAKEFEVKDPKTGEVQNVTASTQNAITFFRTPLGRCVSIQLITNELSDNLLKAYQFSVAGFNDPNPPVKNVKNDKKSDKKSKK